MFFFLLIFFVLTCSFLIFFLTSSLQKSSRHAAHHAEAAGDGREHGNDEIDDSFPCFLFHSFKILIVNVNVLFLFLFFVLNTHTLQKSLMTLIINARLGLFAVGALSAASAVGTVGLQLVHTLDGGIELKA